MRPAYEALALDIKAMGVEVVFGLMSDDTALFATTLDAVGVPFQGARHENTGCCMAEVYAAASDKLGIAFWAADLGRSLGRQCGVDGITSFRHNS